MEGADDPDAELEDQFAVETMLRNGIPEEVTTDDLRLNQILSNLVNNAIKFTEQGEILLLVENAGQDPQSRSLRFTVSDTGIGIPAEMQQAIFEPFQQADSSVTRTMASARLEVSTLLSMFFSEIGSSFVGVGPA